MNYGNKLKLIRTSELLSQEQIAESLNINRSTYKEYELQNSILPSKYLWELGDVLNVSIDYIFDFTEEKILKLARTAADAGIELFVLDDGWFGERSSDRAGLGDWVVNRDRLPDGIPGLASRIREMGMKFGIWIEPEMVNKDSDLYREHPDWILTVPNRNQTHGRYQHVLDFSRKEVVDTIFQMISDILKDGSVTYVKWDMNRSITECWSAALPADRQGEVFHRYILGVYDLYERLTSTFPQVLFESCASGGGRFDPGLLYYAPQGWTSDDTDALERMEIQHGTLRGYPLSSLSNHVTASPNHQNLRRTSLEDRFGTACFGILGYELDLTKLSEEELAAIRDQVSFYKEHRRTLQHGRFSHLPLSDGAVFWMACSDDEMIILEHQMRNGVNTGRHRRLVIPSADPSAVYSIERREKHVFREDLGDKWDEWASVQHQGFSAVVSGSILSSAGIALPSIFTGKAIEPTTRILLDNASDLYVVRRIR